MNLRKAAELLKLGVFELKILLKENHMPVNKGTLFNLDKKSLAFLSERFQRPDLLTYGTSRKKKKPKMKGPKVGLQAFMKQFRLPDEESSVKLVVKELKDEEERLKQVSSNSKVSFGISISENEEDILHRK